MMNNLYLNPSDEHTPTMLLEKGASNRRPSDITAIDSSRRPSENSVILQSCPPADIFCDSASAIEEMLSFDGTEDADELPPVATRAAAAAAVGAVPVTKNGGSVNQTTSPRSVLEQQRRASYQVLESAPLTPTAYTGAEGGGGCCQRRGRFLIWPASLSSPSLGLADTQRA